MDSKLTKARFYLVTEEDHCISQIVAVAERNGLRLYVAWEWKAMADKKVYGFIKSRALFSTFDWKDVLAVADFGIDITGSDEANSIFKNIL